MLLLYMKYSFLFWVLIDSNQGDLLLMRKISEDETLLQVASCTQDCLQENRATYPVKLGFNDCLVDCQNNSNISNGTQVHKIQENFMLSPVCRTESEISFRFVWVQHSIASKQLAPNVIYIIKIAKDVNFIKDTTVYLSDDSFFTLPNLQNNTKYMITTLAVHADGAYSLIGIQEQFGTLRGGYKPDKMGYVQLRSFQQQSDNWQRLEAQVEWQPSADRNCYFDILYYSTNSQSMGAMIPVNIRDPRQLYTYTISNMSFGEQLKVGVRTINEKNNLESPVEWITIQAPNCLDWYNYNYTLCAPLKPSNVSVQQLHMQQNILALNVSWAMPKYLPDYYTLHIFDLHKDSAQFTYRLSGQANSFYIANVTVLGAIFELHLTAHSEGGLNATSVLISKDPMVTWQQKLSIYIDGSLGKLLLFLLIPICCIAVLCSLTLCKQKELKDCEQLETKDLKSAPNLAADFHLSLLNESSLLATLSVDEHFDDELEVEPHDVLLQDVLGEGAFGLVRRGIYQQRQVAVKLLKVERNAEDVQAFKREIQMLKALGRHPNIVGIVGYSTRSSEHMMLLTEYCGLGSLQSFLRNEWKFRQECKNLNQQLPATTVNDSQQSLPTQPLKHLEFHTRIEEINCSMLSTLLEETESEAEAATDTGVKIFNAAANKGYGLHDIENVDGNLMQPTNPVKNRAVSFENREYFCTPQPESQNKTLREPLTDADLLDIAQQVAVGMDFLAQNKIVHRDLAARNVLISLDRTAKIADFGLSRDVYHENVYRKSGGSGKLPIKWLALESLTHQVYTSQSDVWSFGVLLYEISTLGGIPYPSISPGDLLQLLRQGQRMKQPENCSDEMFALMNNCWCSIPANRPTFGELKQQLDIMLLATKQLPQRLHQQSISTAPDALNNMHSRVEQLPPDDRHYLQPLH
ncbi:tyrosine-protein kinase receptor torso [Drosophila busckii]|uniref:tyrosine-protein kinase receptor torso n=1 Tax=Drosophila busckii TaxID=30019 RepID=UPI00083EE6D5|nr:tyrosine-protein kinase receptor torso [Drosophila busckii]